MARIDNLNNFLTDVAGAIKNKTGVTSITPANFDIAINNISTGIEVNGQEQEYYVYTNETVKPGDFCEYVSGIAERASVDFPMTEYEDKTNNVTMRRLGNTNRFLLTYSKGVCIAELNNGTFTYGTMQSFSSTNQVFGCILSEKYFTTYYWSDSTSKPRVYAYLINGYTIKEIGSIQYSNNTETSGFMGIVRLNDTQACAVTSYGAFVVTISDTSISMGNTASASYTWVKSYRVVALNSTTVLYISASHSGSTSTRTVYAYKISGTTITQTDSKNLTGGAYYQPSNYLSTTEKLSDNCCACGHVTSALKYFVPVFVDDAGKITVGTDQLYDTNMGDISLALYADNNSAILMTKRTTDNRRLLYKMFLGEDSTIHFEAYPELLMTDPIQLDGTRTPILTVYTPGTFIVSAENNTFFHFTLPTVETQIRCVTQDKADGVVKVGGIGGTILGGHAQKCIIYQCPTNN